MKTIDWDKALKEACWQFEDEMGESYRRIDRFGRRFATAFNLLNSGLSLLGDTARRTRKGLEQFATLLNEL